MIPYNVLIYMLTRTGTLNEVRSFLGKRFETAERMARFREQLDFMLNNLAGLGYLTRSEDGEHVTLNETIHKLLMFRSVDPLFGAFLVEQLDYADSRREDARAGVGAGGAAEDPAARAAFRICRRGRCRRRCSSRC